LAGYGIFSFSQIKKYKKLAYIVFCVILLGYSFITIDRNSDWKNELTLFENDIAYLHNSAKANGVYGTRILFDLASDPDAGKRTGDIIKSINLLSRSLEIYPDYYSSWNNLGYIYLYFYGTPQKARNYFNKALSIQPEYAEAHFYTGVCFEAEGDFENAVKHYQKAYDINNEDTEAAIKLANWNHKIGNYRQAIRYNKIILGINPHSDIPFINIGNYFYLKNRYDKAFKYWEKAFEQNSENIFILNNLINLSDSLKLEEKNSYYRSILTRKNK